MGRINLNSLWGRKLEGGQTTSSSLAQGEPLACYQHSPVRQYLACNEDKEPELVVMCKALADSTTPPAARLWELFCPTEAGQPHPQDTPTRHAHKTQSHNGSTHTCMWHVYFTTQPHTLTLCTEEQLQHSALRCTYNSHSVLCFQNDAIKGNYDNRYP